MLINLRNALMTGRRLPYDAEVEYIENVVGAWIDTGFVQSSKELECVMSISVPEAAKLVADFDMLFGNEQNDTTAKFVLAKQQKKPYLFWRAGSSSNLGISTAQTGVFIEASLKTDSDNNYTRAVGASTASGTYSGSVVGAANAMAVFAVRTNNSVELPNTAGYRIARLRIFQDNLLVRDYIPVRKGTVGYLYDRVSGKLFGNAGTGDFGVGPDVVPVEYIESHGTEWINTGIVPTADDSFYCRAKQSSIRDQCLWGLAGVAYCFSNWAGGSSGNGTYWGHPAIGTGGVNNVNPLGDTNWHEILCQPSGVFVDGTQINTQVTAPAQSPQNTVALFARSVNSAGGGVAKNGWGRMSAFRIERNGDLLRKYLSVRVGIEGAMMDVLTRRIYRNAGTGAFTYGNDLRYPILAE